MEFYLIAVADCGFYLVFQFPTGWNSTDAPANYDYSAKREFQFPTGWNSTPHDTRDPSPHPVVSIPNGMEFYPHRGLLRHCVNCFNSQRDGILRKPEKPCLQTCLEFQFPTGWNSTQKSPDGVLHIKSVFQFPTGWNSTLQILKTGNEAIEFQFPTGWNSTK